MIRQSTLIATLLGSAATLGLVFNATAQEQPTDEPPAGGRVVFEKEADVPTNVREQFNKNFQWTETESQKDEAAKAAAEAEAAEKAKMEAEKARAQEEAERKRIEAEERQKAEAEAAKQKQAQEAAAAAKQKQAQEEAKAAAAKQKQAQEEAKAAAAKQKQAQEEAKAAAAEAARKAKPASAAGTKPTGRIAEVSIDTDSEWNGLQGVSFNVSGEAAHLDGARLETAVYIFDAAGKAVMDTDDQYRSQTGQVYHGEYRVANGDSYKWSDAVFIPFSQLELGPGRTHNLQAEAVIWEYSQRKGHILARSKKQPFTVVVGPSPADLSGQWSNGVTISAEGDAITVDGLDLRGSIESQRWSLDGNMLKGIVNVHRRFGADRQATYELSLSDDGRTLSGPYTVQTMDGSEVMDSGSLTLTR